MLIGVGFYLGTLVVQFWGSESMPWGRGQRVDRDITARVDFEFEDKEETERRQQTARASAPNVYEANPTPVELARTRLKELRALAMSSGDDLGKLKHEAAAHGWLMDDAAAGALRGYASEQKRSEYENLISALLKRLKAEYIVENPVDPNRKVTPPTSLLRSADQAPEVAEADLLYITDSQAVEDAVGQVVTETEACPPALQGVFTNVIVRVLLGRPDADPRTPNPLWQYRAQATAEKMEEAAERVGRHTILYKAGTTLVEAGTELGPFDLERLRREHEEYLLKEKTDHDLRRKKLLTQLGRAVIVLLVTVGLAAYTMSYQNRILQNPARALGLASLMLLMIALSRLVERMQYPLDLPPEFSTFFIVVAAALLTIAYDQRFAFGASGALTILITLSSRGDLGLFLTFMTAMGITVFALKEIRTRGKLVGVGAMAGVGALLAATATGLIAGQEWRYLLARAASAGGVALFAGFIVQGILHYFERLFGVATSMTLLEWCDASRPLLRRLAQEAPGTYSHSLVLSQMVEEAGEAIGARGLLARVGALYHDIGKTQKAAYFVENQEARISRHDRLSPTMSLLIIVGHVKDGIELARAYGLPRILHQFIAEHHGTTIVRYFHHVASEAAAKNNKTKGRHDREVPESEFRYPGPRPQSKESAILMICDSCEGAVRALSEPTPGRIESTVHQVVMERLNDGQFDDCDITLRELKIVEQSLVKTLCAVHHGRIKYPKGSTDREEGPAGEARAADDRAPVEPAGAAPEVAHQA